mmetsp:Transcript_28717/g.70790  ORF Transcript_28717/g.70790 Transcript_28717/m.70790 type:complete len:215 (-) Transcript_28717:143-787(-)
MVRPIHAPANPRNAPVRIPGACANRQYAATAVPMMMAAARSPPVRCIALPSSGNISLRTRLRMELYRGESLGRGDFGTASIGKSASLGSILNRAMATSGRRWYDSMSAVQSRPTDRFNSQFPLGWRSMNGFRSYATSRYTVHFTPAHLGSLHGSSMLGICMSGRGAVTTGATLAGPVSTAFVVTTHARLDARPRTPATANDARREEVPLRATFI